MVVKDVKFATRKRLQLLFKDSRKEFKIWVATIFACRRNAHQSEPLNSTNRLQPFRDAEFTSWRQTKKREPPAQRLRKRSVARTDRCSFRKPVDSVQFCFQKVKSLSNLVIIVFPINPNDYISVIGVIAFLE